jgi:hypothetical protein
VWLLYEPNAMLFAAYVAPSSLILFSLMMETIRSSESHMTSHPRRRVLQVMRCLSSQNEPPAHGVRSPRVVLVERLLHDRANYFLIHIKAFGVEMKRHNLTETFFRLWNRCRKTNLGHSLLLPTHSSLPVCMLDSCIIIDKRARLRHFKGYGL